MNIYEQIDSNKSLTWVILSVFTLFFLLIGLGFDYFYGIGHKMPIFTVVAFIFGLILAFSSFRYGDRMILSSTHAQPLDLSNLKEKQWQDVVEEVSIAAGVPVPKTYIIDDSDPNAFATGRNPQNSSIVVTQGLLDTLNREEQQAVAAHEMSHVRNYDIRIMLVVSVLVGSIVLLSDWARRSLFYRGRRSSRKSEGSLGLVVLAIWLITVILAPILSQLLAMCVSRKREYLADASGAELTRNPLALASALEKIDSKAEPTSSINGGAAHLCICDPKGRAFNSKEGFIADLFATHPPIAKRIQALNQMAYILKPEAK